MTSDFKCSDKGPIMQALPVSDVPRMIILAMDAFGDKVIRGLREERLREMPASKRSLTAYMYFQAQSGFQLYPDKDPSYAAYGAHHARTNGVGQPLAPERGRIAQQLQKAHAIVSSQLVQAELVRQGLRIDTHLDVYVLSKIASQEHLTQLKDAVQMLNAYFQRFEPLSIAGVLWLSLSEQYATATDDVAVMVQNLDSLLHGDGVVQAPLNRCYLVTNEVMGGRSVLPESELAGRTVGFLAAHYLDVLRQPMTQPQYRLFGERAELGPDIVSAPGLCDIFGYAELRFDFNHVLEWCADHEAQHVLHDAFLVAPEVVTSANELDARIHQTLAQLGIVFQTDQLIDQILQQLSLSGSATESMRASGKPQEILTFWTNVRRERDAYVLVASEESKTWAQQLGIRMETALSALLDESVVGRPDGLAEAEQLLHRIHALCEHERGRLPRLRHDSQIGAYSLEDQVQHEITRAWSRLASAVHAVPSTTVFWSRLGTLALSASFAALIGGPFSMALAGMIGLCAVAWIVYRAWVLPRRIARAQAHFAAVFADRSQALLTEMVRQEVSLLLDRLLAHFAPPAPATPEVAGPEWDALQRWRATLTEALRLFEAAHDRETVGLANTQDSAAVPAWNAEVKVSPAERMVYYTRLTTWHKDDPHRAATLLLTQPRITSRWWRMSSAARLVDDLRKVCRQMYQGHAQSQQVGGIEQYLLEVKAAQQGELGTYLDALAQTSVPMARFHQFHRRWPLPSQRLLLVADPEHSVFGELASGRKLDLLSGALPHQIICIQTIHNIPLSDVTLINEWQQSPVGIAPVPGGA